MKDIRGAIISSSVYNHTTGAEANKSLRLNGSEKEVIGLAKSIKVNPGDTIKMEVFAKYFEPSKDAGPSKVATTMASSFLNAFGIVNSRESQQLYEFFDELYEAGPIFVGNDNADVPKAYLNYLLFDKNHYMVDAGYQPISKAALADGEQGNHEKLTLQAVAPDEGYIYIYLSNENDKIAEVFFDDFVISHSDGPIVQVNHYEPFGGLISSLHYQKSGSYLNRYRYQSKQLQTEFGEGLYDISMPGSMMRHWDDFWE